MITKEEFLNALEIVNNYKIQVSKQYEEMKKNLDDKDFSHFILTPKTRIEDSELSVAAMNILKRCEIEYLGELEQFKKSEIMRFYGIGKKTFSEIENCLFQAGIVLVG